MRSRHSRATKVLHVPAAGDALCRFGSSLVHVSVRPQDAREGTALKLQLLVQLQAGYENSSNVRSVAAAFAEAFGDLHGMVVVVLGEDAGGEKKR